MEGQGPALEALKGALREVTAIGGAAAVLRWDQLTQMPPGGVEGRAEQMATLGRLAHLRLIDPRVGELIAQAGDETASLDPDSDDACLVRLAAREYGRASRLPEDLVAERARVASLANRAWQVARANNDFASFAPWLRQIVELSRRTAECLGYSEHPFDALVDEREPGMTTATVRALFAQLRPALMDLVRRITPQLDSVDDSILRRHYDEALQERMGREIVQAFGYDFSRGRLDRTAHPFAIRLSGGDVRITTRYSPSFLSMSLMGTMHESGHAMYEQGVAPELDGTMLARGTSSGVHESQSRLWENYVGRSRPFWQHWYPRMQAAFPDALGDVEPERFYRAINKVQPSLIRVEADEVTYCLHIILRFELEIALLEGRVRVEEAPEAWNAAMEDYLGIRPRTDTEGVLQDVHWSAGLGGFQGYALGNIIAGQLWEAILAAHPDLPEAIAHGEFGVLREWLRANVHRYGRKFEPAALIERATGKPLSIDPYLSYLRGKFSGIYAGID
jgi:carboxypeptidase Taq